MRGYIDLHSHWVAGVDDGARTVDDSHELLAALASVGFSVVCATPHMRPGLFDNTAAELRRAYEATSAALVGRPGLPERMLGSEHFFDDVVYGRLVAGDALPYPGGRSALVELPPRGFPARLDHRFADLRRRGLLPVLAHPERYDPVWKDIAVLEPLLDAGAVLLLDVAALAGKYGRAPRKAAEALLEEGYYFAACSDAHKAKDAADVKQGIALLFERAGREEAEFLLIEGPRRILEGRADD
jgi:protein-tyrosine phosphatase